MIVTDSSGSSPGRRGFKMAVANNGEMYGSIGGGIMEHKLVEMCLNDLVIGPFGPFIKRQVHRSDIPSDRSGMICSGEQTIAFYSLARKDLVWVKALSKGRPNGVLLASNEGLKYSNNTSLDKEFSTTISSETEWHFQEDLGFRTDLHIIGGGHVGLALSKFAFEMGLDVTVYDDREELNTLKRNQYARTIAVANYGSIADKLETGSRSYVVLMSFGYRTDKVILKQLLDLKLKYLGMMGSKEKVKVLFQELLAEGVEQSEIEKVHSPIGIQINSRTPEEIAISILAEVIQVKNQ